MLKLLLAATALLAVSTAVHATEDFCAVVLKPPAKVRQDKEYNPDAWLTLRDGPGTQFMRMGKLGTGDFLWASTGSCAELNGQTVCDEKDEWTHIIGIPKFDGKPDRDKRSDSQGWVRSKYIQGFACEEDQASQASSGEIKPEDLPGIGLPPSTTTVPAPGLLPK